MNKKKRNAPENEPAQQPTNRIQNNPRPAPPREIGGRKGPDPTRYGDWEKAGKCVDF